MRFFKQIAAYSLLACVAAQQYAGDFINTTIQNVPGSEIAFFKIKDPKGSNASLTLINYYSHQVDTSKRLDPLEIERAVIVIHGDNRDPWTYMSNMLSALAQVQDPNVNFSSVAILAPYFPNGDDKYTAYPWNASLPKEHESYTSALVWYGSEWSGGGNNQYPHSKRTVSSFNVLDQLVQYFDNTTMFPRMKQIVVAGHSMGAQTTQRYVAVGNQLNTNSPVSYWIGNPNSYAWISQSRPLSTFNCPSYDYYREGYSGFDTYGSVTNQTYGVPLVDSGRQKILANFQSKQVAWARGTLDVGDDSSDCRPFSQGGDRNERFFEWIKQFPVSCQNPAGRNCDTVDLVPIGHDAGAMFATPAGLARLFTDNFYGNGSRAYDFGYPREQAGDDPYPNPALVNTPIPRNNNTYAGGMKYIGCYTDQSPPTLPNMTYMSASNTIETCIAACLTGSNTIAAMNGQQCFCGNSLGFQAVEVIDSSCYNQCPGNSNEVCGGVNRLSLFSNAGTPTVQPTPSQPSTIGAFTSQGCFIEPTTGGGHALTALSTSMPNMTNEVCASYCSAYQYFGTEYSTQCYCGLSTTGLNATVASDCNMLCAGSNSEFCGGSSRLDLYANLNYTLPPSLAVNCPGSNNTTYVSNGKNFTVECGFDHSGGDLTSLSTSTLGACIDACAQNSQCVDAVWNGNSCYLKSSLGPAVPNSALSGAHLSNITVGSTTSGGSTGGGGGTTTTGGAGSLSCPANNNQTYTSNGETFIIECGIDHQGGDLSSVSVSGLQGCLDACATTAGCVDAVLSGSACYMKSSLGPALANSALSGGRLANITTAASSSVNVASSSSTPAASSPAGSSAATPTPTSNAPVCPGSNGQTYTAANNETFVIECGIDHQGGDLSSVTVSSLQGCLDACSTTTGCVDAVLSGSACYMKSTLGPALQNSALSGGRLANVTLPSSSSSSSVASSTPAVSSTPASSTTSSSAAASPTATGPSCPASNGTIYTAANNETFIIECNTDHQGGDYQQAYGVTFQQCIEDCAALPLCVDVSLSGTACYMKSSVGAAVSNGVWGARLLTNSTNSVASSSSSSSVAAASTPASSSSSSSSSVAAASTPASSSPSSSSAASPTPTPSSSSAVASSTPSSSVTPAPSTPTPSSSVAASSSSSSSSTSSAAALPSNYVALGCYVDNTNNARALPYSASPSSNTPANCAAACSKLGYKYSGTEYSSQCFCGPTLPNTNTTASTCNMACSGDSTQTCGGPNRLNIVQDLSWKQTFFVRQSYQTWNLAGCYVDVVSNRTLPNGVNLNAYGGANNATIANCLSACQAAGYTYCGEEYYTQCYGSNTAPAASLIASPANDPLAAGCGYACAGNSTESCGGSNRIIVYVNNGTAAAPARFRRF